MPFEHDPLTQIVNVHWGGGSVFVTGDHGSFQKYANITGSDDPIEFESVTNESFDYKGITNNGWINGGCYRNMAAEGGTPKPVFLMVGNNGAIVTGDDDWNAFRGVISYSENGKDWRTVFTAIADSAQANNIASADIFGVVWDEDANAFFAGGHYFRQDEEAESGQSDLDKLWRSTDGLNWVEAGSVPTTEETDTGLFANHLNNKAKLPGGVFGYHEEKDEDGNITRSILIVPVTPPKIDYASRQPSDTIPPVAAYFQNRSISTKGAGNQVKITIQEGGNTRIKTVTVTDLTFVNCCAYAEDIFIAAGGIGASDPLDVADGRIAVSFDEGETWQIAGNSLYQVLTVSGASQADVGL